MLLIRLVVSVAILIAHVVLTVHVWRSEGWIAGLVTAACMLFAEVYWAGKWALAGDVLVPAVLFGLTAAYFVFFVVIFPRLAAAWQETGLGSDEED